MIINDYQISFFVMKISLLEIQEKSKGDSAAKAITVVQTLWFLLQTLNRAAQRLFITELELTTVAYVALYLFISWCWWNKPLDIQIPVDVHLRVDRDVEREESTVGENEGPLQKEGENPEGRQGTPRSPTDGELQDPQKQLPLRVKMGTYLVMKGDPSALKFLTILTLIFVGISLFGAIHCIAWKWNKNPKLWRISAILVTVLPAAFMVLSPLVGESLGTFIAVLMMLGYIVARITLLVLTFHAARFLPYDAFVTPSWTVHIPHIS
jgi:hypothetical protein